jgi:prefoldin subunit 5
MNIINKIKKWFSNKKKKKIIFNEIKKSTKRFEPANKRLKEISKGVKRGVEIFQYLESKERGKIKEDRDEKLLYDLKSVIEKHFSKENEFLKNQNEHLNETIISSNKIIRKLNDEIDKLKDKIKTLESK